MSSKPSLLSTVPERRFDAIARAAAWITGVPNAMVLFIDQERVCFRSAVGCFAAGEDSSREIALHAHALLDGGRMMIIEDMSLEPRFRDNPLVNEGVRFYAGVPLFDGQGRAPGMVCLLDKVPHRLSSDQIDLLHDLAEAAGAVLELHRSLAALRRSVEHYNTATELNPQVTWCTNKDGQMDHSARIEALCGASVERLSGSGWLDFIHPEERAAVKQRWGQALRSGEHYKIEHRIRVADGGWRWVRAYAAPHRDEAGEIDRWYGFLEDITERRKAEARLAHMAYHDGLTDLPNAIRLREAVAERLRAVAVAGPFALISIDLDNFKVINDTLGHPAGDALLCRVAERLTGAAGLDDLVARISGDEFFVMRRRCATAEAAGALAERLLAALRAPILIEGQSVSLSASMGVLQVVDTATSVDTLFHNADLALYRAKTDERGTVRVYQPAMDEKQRQRERLEMDLGWALTTCQLALAFQPLLNLHTGQIECFEALLRWNHPARGLVPPDAFVGLAERSGLIVPIGAWALEQACRVAATWPERVRVAVNLSPVQFRHDLVAKVMTALNGSGLAPDRLELEITESVLLLGDDANLAVLLRLRALGVRIALDDFGTGYSSLAYLQRFRFDKLKIDRSFITMLPHSPEARTIVRAITAMSHSLGIMTTAEGIETPEQLEMLRAESCDQAQGFLISKPVSPSEVPMLLRRAGVGGWQPQAIAASEPMAAPADDPSAAMRANVQPVAAQSVAVQSVAVQPVAVQPVAVQHVAGQYGAAQHGAALHEAGPHVDGQRGAVPPADQRAAARSRRSGGRVGRPAWPDGRADTALEDAADTGGPVVQIHSRVRKYKRAK